MILVVNPVVNPVVTLGRLVDAVLYILLDDDLELYLFRSILACIRFLLAFKIFHIAVLPSSAHLFLSGHLPQEATIFVCMDWQLDVRHPATPRTPKKPGPQTCLR